MNETIITLLPGKVLRIHVGNRIKPTPIKRTKAIASRSDKGKTRTKYDSKLSPKYKSYLMRSNRKGIDMDLTEEEFKNIILLDCYYCGTSDNIGVDRIDSSKGYTIDNSRPCCPQCNMMKYIHTEEIFISHIRKIIKHMNILL